MVLAVIFVVALGSGPAADTGGEMARGATLYRGCQAELRLMEPGAMAQAPAGDLINGSYCIGYLNGFVANLSSTPATICPGDRSMAQIVRAYVDFLDRNQQLLEQDKRVGVRLALETTFPCPTPAGTLAPLGAQHRNRL